MSGGVRPLAAGFPQADIDAWRARAKEALGLSKHADDAELDQRLVRRTLDGIARGPLWTRGSLRDREPSFEGRSGADYPWDIRPAIDHPDPAQANAIALEELKGGAASIEIRIDPSGARGVMIRGLDDMARALDGVRLDLAAVSLDAGDTAAAAAAMLVAHAQAAGPDAAAWRMALNLDPLGLQAATGKAGEIDDAAAWAAWISETWPSVTTFRADGRVVHEAGGSEAWELAFAAASGFSYLEAMVRRGLSADAAARQVMLAMSLDADVHLGVVKLRALRRVWRRIATACGASPEAAQARVHAFSSRRMLAQLDPWTNLMRLTSAGFAGAAGGADVMTLAPFTAALGAPTPFARRLSRGIQLVIAEEAGVGRVGDPARGSFHHEAMTDALARQAWSAIQEIAKLGGPARFIADGALRRVVDAARARREDAVARREQVLVGVSDFVSAEPQTVEVEKPDLDALRAEADKRSTRRPKPGSAQSGAPADLVALAASGADMASLVAEAPGTQGVALRPVRLAEPFEPAEPRS